MNLSPEQRAIGKRNFDQAIGAATLKTLHPLLDTSTPLPGGRVRIALIGIGGQGSNLLARLPHPWVEARAVCDINPDRRRRAVDALSRAGAPNVHGYEDWQEMLRSEDVEAVLIATPLWTHAEIAVGCLEANLHVFCEKMMAISVEECRRMLETSRRRRRLLQIGYQRYYNKMYQAARETIIQSGRLGEIHYVRTAWHRNGDWRKDDPPPTTTFDPRRWGYPDWEHLSNWRLYRRYSRGLIAELGSHLITVGNWFLDAVPTSVQASGGTYRYRDGREVPDHIYATFVYPGGRTLTFSSIESNAFEHYYEQFLGTEGTLVLRGEVEGFLWTEKDGKDAAATPTASAVDGSAKGQRELDPRDAYGTEIAGFCWSIRTGAPLLVPPEKALASAAACLAAFEAVDRKARIEIALPALTESHATAHAGAPSK